MAATATGHRLRRLRNFLPHFPLGPKVQPEGQRGRGGHSASPGKAAGCAAPTRSRCRSRAAGSPAGDYMAAARPREPAAKLPAAQIWRPTGAPARGDRPARAGALRSTILASCARAAGTAASPAKPASGQERAGGGDGQPGEPMAGQARRWAEAAAPPAARASGRGGGARRGLRDPAERWGPRDWGEAVAEGAPGAWNRSQRLGLRT